MTGDREAKWYEAIVYLLPFAAAGVAAWLNSSEERMKEFVSEKSQEMGIESVVKAEPVQVEVEERKAEPVPEPEYEEEKYEISQKGLDLIKSFEGFSETVYKCPAGKDTIGYGHLLRPGESFESITREQAEDLLRKDVDFAEDVVDKYVNVPLSQGQYDALVSFVYNLGERNFRDSTLLRKLNSKDYEGAANEFNRWVYASGRKLKGLERRRAQERELFTGE